MNPVQREVTTEEIWRELSDRLRQFIRSRVHCEADVDDILQTVFLRIHQNFAALGRVQRMEPWVFQITRNAITDHFRKRHPVPSGDASTLPVAPPSSEENLNGEVAGCIATLIDHLPEDQRRAVTMYELEGVSQADVARQESISISGAKSRIQRGRKKLETMLRECCQFQIDTRGNILAYQAASNSCGPNPPPQCQ